MMLPDILRGAQVFSHRNELHAWAIDHSPAAGVAVEFGVGSTYTLRRFAQRRFIYGFDSFEGLPEDWRPGFPRGIFATAPPGRIDNAEVITGLFADTVPRFLAGRSAVAFCHIDCDLYSSTATALRIAPLLLEGAVIVFDEYFNYPGWESNEHRALLESGIEFSYAAYVDPDRTEPPYGEQVAVVVKTGTQ